MPATINEVLSRVDLVVLGTIESRETYLSEDERTLYTDYRVAPRQIILDFTVPSSKTPGSPSPIVVRRWGGRTVINGVQVTVEDADFRDFELEEEVYLFLQHKPADGKYEIVDLAAFPVVHGQIRPIVNHPNHGRFKGWTSRQFQAEVQRLRSHARSQP